MQSKRFSAAYETYKSWNNRLGTHGGLLSEFRKSPRWEVVTICELNESRHDEIRAGVPGVKVVTNDDEIFNDPSIDAVVLSALADTRLSRIRKAVASGKHIIAEKPILLKTNGRR